MTKKINLAGIVIDNNYEWTFEEELIPPQSKSLEVSDIIALRTFKFVRISRTSHYFAKWKKLKVAILLENGSLEIPGASIKGNEGLSSRIDSSALSGGWDLWCCIENQFEPLISVLKTVGGKFLLGDLGTLKSELIDEELQSEVLEWGIESVFYVGFAHDLDYIYILGEKGEILELYKSLPKVELTGYPAISPRDGS